MIRAYLRSRRNILFLYVAMILFLPIVELLSRNPVGPLFYGILIITFLLFLGLLADGSRFYAKYKHLQNIRTNLSAYSHDWPKESDLLEATYQEIISRLCADLESERAAAEIAQLQQLEYYTMWIHQMKTPIAAMWLALHSDSPDKDVLEQELFKIEQYTEMVLHYAKLESIPADLVIKECSVEEIVRQCIKKYAALFIYKNLTASVEVGDVTVLTDSKWLAFIIEQLLSNAIKYTNSGGVTVTFSANTLLIADTGIGIRPEDLELVFEKGYTGYNGRLDKRASGIGLYLAKKASVAVAIQIRLSSELGRGTNVYLTFPEASICAE